MTANTLIAPFAVEGTGIHTGAPVRVEVRPSATPRGRLFIRNNVEIPAHVTCVTDTRRCTTLGCNGQTVSTVEHLLAALVLANVDQVEIVVDGPELPALDGSAHQWYTAICEAGIRPMDVERKEVRITDAQWVVMGESQFFLTPADDLTVYAALSILDTVAEHMLAGGPVSNQTVREQIVRARTFGLEREVQALLDAGLALGGSLENAVILTETGYLNDQVWPNEPAWHKSLDLLGDLALLGAHVRGQILAVRNGHHSNVELVRRLSK